MKKSPNYFAWGLTATLSICAVLMFYDLVFRSSMIMVYVRKFMEILAPIVYGCALAYLLAPIVNWIETFLFRRAGKHITKWLRAISIVFAWVLVLALLAGLLWILVPQLVTSIARLAANAQGYYQTMVRWVQHLLENNPEYAAQVQAIFDRYYQDALTWVQENLLPQVQVALEAITGGVVGIVVFFKNLLIGIIISIYLLAMKESFAAGSCKLCYALLSEERAAWLIRGVKKTDNIFSNFVRGKLLDSLIIGILCFIFSGILDFPYAPLISVVVGVTNIIPFFGPFLGAIPSAFLILLDSPIKSLYFIIFIIILQQFDGNILGPKILGGSTGIHGFWVIVAILVGGGLWGVPGMFLGVPIFACLYAGVRSFTAYQLRKKDLPTSTASYYTHNPIWHEDTPPKEEEGTPKAEK